MLPVRGVLLWLAAAACVYAEVPGAIAIRDARVVTVSGPVLERGTVVIRDGLIEAAGAGVTVPADAWVIDGTGLTVYPGLIDALGSTGIPEAAPTPAPASAPLARISRSAARTADAPATKGPEDRPSNNSWIRAADLVDPADSRIEAARSAGFTSAVAVPTGAIVAGQAALLNLGQKKSRMIVAAPVAQYITLDRRGSAGEFPASLLGEIAYVRQLILDAGSYRLEQAAYARHAAGARRPDYDRALEGLLESPRLLLPARSAVEIERLIRFAAELKTPAAIYGAAEAYGAATVVAQSQTPLLLSLKWPERLPDSDPDAPVSLRTLELWDLAPSSAAALAKAGARFAFYLDGTALRDVPKAVRRALEAGLSSADAVRAFTLGAAEIFGAADRLGSIEKGKIANLVVTTGELFQESTQVKYVFVDGVKYEPAPAAEPAGGARGGVE